MESTVEQRLTFLEARVKTLERLLDADGVSVPRPAPFPPARAAAPSVAGAVGALALVTAVRWNSQEIAGIGIVGALLAPVFVDCGTSTSSLVFMTIALLAAIGVVVYRRWAWLAVIAYVVSVPQAAYWLYGEHDHRLALTLVVAWVGRRTDTPERGLAAALVFAGLAGVHALVFEARPDALAYGLHSIPLAFGAVGLVVLALAGIAAMYEEVREPLAWVGAGLGVYLARCLVVDLAGAHAGP